MIFIYLGHKLHYTFENTHVCRHRIDVGRDVLICGTPCTHHLRTHTRCGTVLNWDMTHLYVGRDPHDSSESTRVSACNCMRDGTCGIWLVHISYECMMWDHTKEPVSPMNTCVSMQLYAGWNLWDNTKEPVSPMNQSNPTCYNPHTLLRRFMGWLRLEGSLKLQVSFAKEPVSPMNQSNPTCYIPHTIRCDTGSLAETYGVATISRLLKITSLFCKKAGFPYEPIKFRMLHPAYNSVGRRWDTGSLAEMYGVATISRLLKIAGLFCKGAL